MALKYEFVLEFEILFPPERKRNERRNKFTNVRQYTTIPCRV